MSDSSEDVSTALRRLRRQAATENNPEKLRTIAAQMLRVLKKDSPSSPHPCAQQVRELRKKLKLSQMQLATRLNYSAMAISRWERGLQEPPTRCLIEMGKMAGPKQGLAFWKMAGITIEDVRAMLNGRVAVKP